MLLSILGIIGTVFAISMYAPQVLKVYKNKSAKGLSASSFMIIIIGTLMWVMFCSLNRAFFPWITNVVISSMMMIIIWYLYNKKTAISIISAMVVFQVFSILFLTVIKTNISDVMSSAIVLIAGFGTGCGMFVQVYSVIKTKDSKNLSSIMLFLIIINQTIWTIWWSLTFVDNQAFQNILCIIFSVLPIVSSLLLIFLKYIYSK